MSKKTKQTKLFSVKVRIKSRTPNVVIKPSLRVGIVVSTSQKEAEQTALNTFNTDLRLVELNAFAQIISSTRLRKDFIFTSKG